MKNKTNIVGLYKFKITFQNMFNTYTISTNVNKNLITSFGEKFFTERWIDNTLGVLSKIVIGKGTNAPSKLDTSLINQTGELTTTITNNTSNILLTATVNGSELNDTTEIGVKNTDEKLISRDVHKAIQVPYSSNITINYMYSIQTGVYKSGWVRQDIYENVYLIDETEEINVIFETDTNSGYMKKSTLTDVNSTPGSYYQDLTNKKIYIHTTDAVNPNSHNILVSYKGA